MYQKCCLLSFTFTIKMTAQKFTILISFFKMHTDRTAVTIQSNKVVSNEVKDN